MSTALQNAQLPALFIADLHIAPERPDIMSAFVHFCRQPARNAAEVFILGDLFEVWIGDDDDDPAWQQAESALRELTAAGIGVYFLPGNRDFLVGDEFARRTGIERLPDPTLLQLGTRRTLLTHGDALCTDDTDHQAFRDEVGTPEWRQAFLARPLVERREIASSMRTASRASVSDKAAAIMDVNADAVVHAAATYEADTIIHGHTHRPGRHEHPVDGRSVERRVLGDWFEQGSMLLADTDGSLRDIPLDVAES